MSQCSTTCVCVLYKITQGHSWTPFQLFCRGFCGLPIPRGCSAQSQVAFWSLLPFQGKLRNELGLLLCRAATQGTGLRSCVPWEYRCAQALLWLWFCESLLPAVIQWWERAGFDKNGNICLWVERLFHLWLYLLSVLSSSSLSNLGQKICWFSLFSALALYWRVLNNGDALGYVIPARWLCSVWHFGESCPAWW